MKFEKQLFNSVKSLGYDTYWIFKNMEEPETKFPLIVLSYINDDQPLYVDGTASAKNGRMTFSIFAKTEDKVLDMKEELRNYLLSGSLAKDFSFTENSGLTDFNNDANAFGYQLDFSYVFIGNE